MKEFSIERIILILKNGHSRRVQVMLNLKKELDIMKKEELNLKKKLVKILYF